MKILVGIDGSSHADRALAWALRETTLHDGSLTVLHAFHVQEFAGPMGSDVSLESEREQAHAVASQAVERVSGQAQPPGVDIETTAVMGRGGADAILRHRGEADLIVLGSRGLGGFSGLRLGSVSQQVAAHADVPVAVIPRDGDDIDDASDGTRSIVVGIDGSDASVRALRWAAAEARVRGVPVTAVYAFRSLRDGAPFDAFASIEREQLDELEDHANGTARRKLDALIAEVGDIDGAQIERRVEAGSAARVLTADAADRSNLLVVGSRGHGGFRGLLLGSVSQQCIQHARGPVVVTPAMH